MSFIDVDLSSAPIAVPPPESPKEMLTIKQVGAQTQVRINYSSLSLIQTCPRKAYYTLNQCLKPRNGSPALEFGSAIHAALEVFYSERRESRVLPPNMAKNMDIMASGGEVPDEKEYLIYRATRAFIDRASLLVDLPPTDRRSIANGAWILSEYFKEYQNDPYQVYIDGDGPFVERRLEAVVYDSPELLITNFGTIDLGMQNIATGQLVFCDHKTTSQVGQDFFNRLKPNHQYTGYLFLVNEALGIPTETFLVNGIETKAKPKTARGKGPHFPRQPTKRTQEDFEAYKQAVVHYVKLYLQWLETNIWPQGSVDSCAFWGGCGYLKVCSAPNSIRKNIISADFVERPWGDA